jgi:ketosteroid isomerase-like protein
MKKIKGLKNTEGEALVRGLWEAFNSLRWDDAEMLLGKKFVGVWPQSGEKMAGAKNFIAVNRNYPGKHKITVKSISMLGDRVVSEVFIKSVMPDGKRLSLFAVSFFKIKEGKIVEAREYWADTYPAPSWRKKWVKEI